MKSQFLALVVVSSIWAAPVAAAPLVSHRSVSAPQPNAVVCKLQYRGGPLIQHVKVFDVFYSKNNPYRDQFSDFYTAITQSAHFDMLQEYDVANYKIRRGSFIGLFEDSNPNPTTPQAFDAEMYLTGLLQAKKVPPPDDDTLYMLYFPSGIDPQLQGTNSCVTGGLFCAFHNSFTFGGQLVRYGVMPDMSAGMCAGGCGPAGFSGMCDVSSHELLEAVTDPDQNTAWVDFTKGCGENGDICAGMPNETGLIAGFTVQKEWSNAKNACIVSNADIQVSDFSLATTPTTVTVPIGSSATAAIAVTKVSGTAENVTLSSAAATTTGLTASFAPASVSSAGGTTMMTVSAGANATIGMTKLTVKAAGSVVSHTQTVLVMIVAPLDMAMSPDLAAATANHAGGSSGCSVMDGRGGSSGGVLILLLFVAGMLVRARRRT